MESRLITPELEKRLAEYPLGSQDGKGKSAMCVAVFHIGRIRWYVLEGGREGEDFILYCIACGMAETEYGYARYARWKRLRWTAASLAFR